VESWRISEASPVGYFVTGLAIVGGHSGAAAHRQMTSLELLAT
jgi:hypothetical protein